MNTFLRLSHENTNSDNGDYFDWNQLGRFDFPAGFGNAERA